MGGCLDWICGRQTYFTCSVMLICDLQHCVNPPNGISAIILRRRVGHCESIIVSYSLSFQTVPIDHYNTHRIKLWIKDSQFQSAPLIIHLALIPEHSTKSLLCQMIR